MTAPRELADVSFRLLRAVRRGEPAEEYVETIAGLDDSALGSLRDDPDAAKAFWLNLYNAAVQRHLAADPSLYGDKRRFFGGKRLTVAGTDLSLDDVEHGLLRGSKWKYGLGYLPRVRPSAFERRHRLDDLDPRIHFALNCGAESCPPIVAYSPDGVDAELDTATRSFLDQSAEYDEATDTLRVTRLLLYYRGDFGGRRGIYEFLRRHGVLADGETPRVRYKSYDWTLQTAKYREG